jgi:hypothetical protein
MQQTLRSLLGLDYVFSVSYLFCLQHVVFNRDSGDLRLGYIDRTFRAGELSKQTTWNDLRTIFNNTFKVPFFSWTK